MDCVQCGHLDHTGMVCHCRCRFPWPDLVPGARAWEEAWDRSERLYLWSMGLFVAAMVLFNTPVGPLGIPVALVGVVLGVKACRAV